MYYCFLEDSGFYPEQKIDLGKVSTPKYGYFGSIEESYFNTKATLLDKRTSRHDFTNLTNTQNIKLFFDQSKVEENKDLFSVISDDNYRHLFDMFEYIYLDQKNNRTTDNIETDLRQFANFYVTDSFQIAYGDDTLPYYYDGIIPNKIVAIDNLSKINNITSNTVAINDVVYIRDSGTYLKVIDLSKLNYVPPRLNNAQQQEESTSSNGSSGYIDITAKAVKYFSGS